MDGSYAEALERNWTRLEPWPDVRPVLSDLAKTHRLGVVTNCSERQGRIAAACVGVPFEVIVTSEAAGFYKPDPHPYRMALEHLALPPERVLFVAGSAYDLFGTALVGLDTYWHNRVGLAAPAGAPQPLMESRTLQALPRLALAS
jgi:2-haloalkanoic acid dehalogenase type II